MYTEHYGLTGNPFQLTPDPRFWFESETHHKAMAYLGYGLAQGEGFIVITGDIGAGKTTLVAHLMATVDSSRLTAVELVSTQVEGDDMIRLVAQRLGVPSEGAAKAQLLDRIERFFHDQARTGKRTLLIVDEAQNLGTTALEELRMLSNFQSGGRALVQIFLLGQPEFRDRVKKAPDLEQLRQRVIATHHLEPMQSAEVEPYVVHRLSVAGWEGVPQFTAEAFSSLYRATGGVPRKLNTLMSRVLLYGAVEELKVIDCQAVDAVVADIAGDTDETETAYEPAPAQVEPEAAAGREAASPASEASIRPVEAEYVTPASETVDEVVPEARSEISTEEAVEPDSAPAEFEADSVSEPAAAPVDDQRVAALEARLEEQEAALLRVLTLLVQWVEEEEARPHFDVVRGSAA